MQKRRSANQDSCVRSTGALVVQKLVGSCKPQLRNHGAVATRQSFDLVLRRLKVVFAVTSNRAIDAVPLQQIGQFPNGRRKKENRMKPKRTNVIRKLFAVAVLATVPMGTTLLLERTVRVAAAPPPTGVKNVVLVHGAFADGSGWEAVAKILEKDGYTVSVAQPPETSYADDQKYTRAAIDAMDGPVVLVGHSYGGSIITEAGNDPKVSALVYIAAFALDEGESCASIEQTLPQASKAFKPDSNGNWWIDEEHFAADIPPEKAWFMAISQVPISTDSFTHKVTKPAWKTKPTWYMVAAADRSINPDQERMR